jgi:hypothetical protein
VTGLCQHGRVLSGHIKGVEFLDQVSDIQLLKIALYHRA